MADTLATEQNEIYKSLPGVEVPVGDALVSLSNMWNAPPSSEGIRPPSEFRASRMNFILHFGFEASSDDAVALFRSVIRFFRRYPCRIIALCPSKDETASGQGIVCKIFSECYIGEGQGDMSCCEAIIFGYTLKEKQYLEDQISVFLESDLPTYYWPYRFDSPENLSQYQSFFKDVDRVVLDSAVESYSPDSLAVSEMGKIHDLAFDRTLALRQSIGQFFSAFPVPSIVEELVSVSVETPVSLEAEMNALISWIRGVLGDCGENASTEIAYECQLSDSDSQCPRLRFSYRNDNFADCRLNLECGVAQLTAKIGDSSQSMSSAVKLLEADDALAEALFF